MSFYWNTLKLTDWLGDLFGAKIWRFPEFKHFVNTYNWTKNSSGCVFCSGFFSAPKERRYYHWWFRCCTSHCGRTLLGGWRNHPIEVPKTPPQKKTWWENLSYMGKGSYLRGGNSNILYFHPYLGEGSNLTSIFQMGWNHQRDTFGVSPTYDASEIITCSFLWRAPELNLHGLQC